MYPSARYIDYITFVILILHVQAVCVNIWEWHCAYQANPIYRNWVCSAVWSAEKNSWRGKNGKPLTPDWFHQSFKSLRIHSEGYFHFM